jgi:hypothetical protein
MQGYQVKEKTAIVPHSILDLTHLFTLIQDLTNAVWLEIP